MYCLEMLNCVCVFFTRTQDDDDSDELFSGDSVQVEAEFAELVQWLTDVEHRLHLMDEEMDGGARKKRQKSVCDNYHQMYFLTASRHV